MEEGNAELENEIDAVEEALEDIQDNEMPEASGASGNANEAPSAGLFGGKPSAPGKQVGTYDCDDGCEMSQGSPVCGADGKTYFNECLAVCQDVEVERNGACPSDPPMNLASFIAEGKVTKAEMNAFKEEKFKLVAKRNPHFGQLPDGREPHGLNNDPSNDNPGTSPRSAKASRITADGLEYVAEYDMDDIDEGDDYEASDGEMPETADGDMPAPADNWPNRLLSVIGVDTRVQENSFTWPNWRLAQLDYWSGWWIFASWSGRCSGTIIGPNKVLTAAHCVYDTTDKAWMVPGRVAPGRSGSLDPWGRWDVSYATTYTAWTNDGKWDYDIAVLTIKSSGSSINNNIGTYMGYLGMKQQPCSYTESQWSITGYPGDKADGTIWNTRVCDDWSYSCGSRKIYHKCDTFGGMSGSAIRNGSNQVVGVHAYGNGGSGFNSGTALNWFHRANVQNW